METALAGLILGVIAGYAIGRQVERIRNRRAGGGGGGQQVPPSGPLEEIKRILPGFVVVTVVIIALIATHPPE